MANIITETIHDNVWNLQRRQIPRQGTPIEWIIAEIQAMLYALSIAIPEIERINIDGIFASSTADSVKSFQRWAGLEITGIVNYDTFTSLTITYIEIAAQNREPNMISPFNQYLSSAEVS